MIKMHKYMLHAASINFLNSKSGWKLEWTYIVDLLEHSKLI